MKANRQRAKRIVDGMRFEERRNGDYAARDWAISEIENLIDEALIAQQGYIVGYIRSYGWDILNLKDKNDIAEFIITLGLAELPDEQ